MILGSLLVLASAALTSSYLFSGPIPKPDLLSLIESCLGLRISNAQLRYLLENALLVAAIALVALAGDGLMALGLRGRIRG